MRVLNEFLLNGADASINETSLQGLLAHAIGYSIQATFTGSPVGIISLQGSSDPVPDSNFQVSTYPVVNWTDIANSSQAVNGAGHVDYNVANVSYNWVRVLYLATSGTGTITIKLNTKGF